MDSHLCIDNGKSDLQKTNDPTSLLPQILSQPRLFLDRARVSYHLCPPLLAHMHPSIIRFSILVLAIVMCLSNLSPKFSTSFQVTFLLFTHSSFLIASPTQLKLVSWGLSNSFCLECFLLQKFACRIFSLHLIVFLYLIGG